MPEGFKKATPSIITSCNLVAGCMAVYFGSLGKLQLAGTWILAASLFDFLDGMTARLLNSQSEFGKQLDSLADVVSFGVAPAFIIQQLFLYTAYLPMPSPYSGGETVRFSLKLLSWSSYLIVVFSALRLAKFNLDKGQSKVFKGLPTPANALMIAGMAFVAEKDHLMALEKIIFRPGFLVVFVMVSCALLISNIKMFSLKFATFVIKENYLRYSFLLVSLLLLFFYKLPALAPIIVIYIMLSLLSNYLSGHKVNREEVTR